LSYHPENLMELKECLENAEQCTWRCPYCDTQCGGIGMTLFNRNNQKILITKHSGPHQCEIHSRRSANIIILLRVK